MTRKLLGKGAHALCLSPVSSFKVRFHGNFLGQWLSPSFPAQEGEARAPSLGLVPSCPHGPPEKSWVRAAGAEAGAGLRSLLA